MSSAELTAIIKMYIFLPTDSENVFLSMKVKGLTWTLREIGSWDGVAPKEPQKGGRKEKKPSHKTSTLRSSQRGTLSLLHKYKSATEEKGLRGRRREAILNYYSDFHGFLRRIIRALRQPAMRLPDSLKGDEDKLMEPGDAFTCKTEDKKRNVRRHQRCWWTTCFLPVFVQQNRLRRRIMSLNKTFLLDAALERDKSIFL